MRKCELDQCGVDCDDDCDCVCHTLGYRADEDEDLDEYEITDTPDAGKDAWQLDAETLQASGWGIAGMDF